MDGENIEIKYAVWCVKDGNDVFEAARDTLAEAQVIKEKLRNGGQVTCIWIEKSNVKDFQKDTEHVVDSEVIDYWEKDSGGKNISHPEATIQQPVQVAQQGGEAKVAEVHKDWRDYYGDYGDLLGMGFMFHKEGEEIRKKYEKPEVVQKTDNAPKPEPKPEPKPDEPIQKTDNSASQQQPVSTTGDGAQNNNEPIEGQQQPNQGAIDNNMNNSTSDKKKQMVDSIIKELNEAKAKNVQQKEDEIIFEADDNTDYKMVMLILAKTNSEIKGQGENKYKIEIENNNAINNNNNNENNNNINS